MATKAFTKGQEVTILRSWDNKGTVYYINAIVHSCGAKRMILTNAVTGEEIGRNFQPIRANEENFSRDFAYTAVFPRLSAEEATRIGLKLGALVVADEIAHAEKRIAHYAHDEAFCNAMRNGLATLHEPQVIDRTQVA